MRIKDVMTHSQVTCRADMHVDSVVRLMAEFDVNAVLIVDSTGELQGLLSERDICLGALRHARPLDQILVTEVLPNNVFSCTENDHVESVERLMRDLHLRRVPVTDVTGSPVGILTIEDLARLAIRAKLRTMDQYAMA